MVKYIIINLEIDVKFLIKSLYETQSNKINNIINENYTIKEIDEIINELDKNMCNN